MSNTLLVDTIQRETGGEATLSDKQIYRTGMEVEVHQIIREGEKERIQKFRGLIIASRGSSSFDLTITVRSNFQGIGIEKIFPVNSPMIAKIDILRRFKVRRKNIGYIRDLSGKAARLKEIK